MNIKGYIRGLGLLGATLFCLLLVSCNAIRPVSKGGRHATPSEREKDAELINKYEQIIGAPINAGKSLALYKAIDGWMGVPYQYGAMTKSGTDCSGFTAAIYEEVYHIRLSHSSLEQFEKDVHVISKRRLQEGDLVFFSIEEGKKISHVGIYLGNNKFVHASTKKGVCINDMTERYYEQHFKKAGRVKTELADKND
jgi:cell wall-associated NlpC family hydrolase